MILTTYVWYARRDKMVDARSVNPVTSGSVPDDVALSSQVLSSNKMASFFPAGEYSTSASPDPMCQDSMDNYTGCAWFQLTAK